MPCRWLSWQPRIICVTASGAHPVGGGAASLQGVPQLLRGHGALSAGRAGLHGLHQLLVRIQPDHAAGPARCAVL